MTATIERSVDLAGAATPPRVDQATILLASLGPELAARVLSHLDDATVETAMISMARLGRVAAQERDRVIADFELHMAEQVVTGGVDTAREILQTVVGPERAGRMLSKLHPSSEPATDMQETLGDMIQSVSPESLAALMADEHPQVIALLANHLTVEAAALFLSALPRALQGPVAARLAEMEEPSELAVAHLTALVSERLRHTRATVGEKRPSGFRRVADILGRMRQSKEAALIEDLETQAPTVVEKVNQYRVTVEQILALEGQALQRVLRELDAAQLPVLMKGLDDIRQETILANMSERAAERLREEIEEMGPVKLREIERAKQQLIGVARGLDERGEIRLREESGAEGDEDA